MANQECCERRKVQIDTVIVDLLNSLDKPRSALEVKERLQLQALEIAMLLCDEIGPQAEYEDVNLQLVYDKVDQVLSRVRRILVDRAKRRQGRAPGA